MNIKAHVLDILQHRRPGTEKFLAASTFVALLLSGCVESQAPKKLTIEPRYMLKLGNVAGGCLVDGAKIRNGFPLPDGNGRPSDTIFSGLIQELDLDGTKGNGVQSGSIFDVSQNTDKVACFDIPSKNLTMVETKKDNDSTRFWYLLTKEQLSTNPKLNNLVQAIEKNGLSSVAVASDGFLPAGTSEGLTVSSLK